MPKIIYFKKDKLYYLDQRLLPQKAVYKECRNIIGGYKAIKNLSVRGAPLIGVFAAYCLYLGIKDVPPNDKKRFFLILERSINYLKRARPTAVNLFWALDRIKNLVYFNRDKSVKALKYLIIKEARNIHQEDKALCEAMAKQGVRLIKRGDRILTHCNSGFLATAGEGTALGVIYEAFRRYKDILVYVDETRPLLQGARLTTWELMQKKIPAILICDNMAAYLMQQKKIDKIFVGADRITKRGDVANKIGTYNLAVLANYHKIPFYVVAPYSTFDLSLSKGEDIPIEERNAQEVRKVVNKVYISPKKIKVYNPAFDITPHHLITAIITEKGIIYPPFSHNLSPTNRGK